MGKVVHAPQCDDDLADLIAGCRQGQDGAKAQFYSRYTGLIRRAVARRLARVGPAALAAADVDDICHEIFVRLFSDDCRALGSIKNPKSINAWLMTVAQNHTVTHFRKRTLRDHTLVSAAREGPEEYSASPADAIIHDERRAFLEDKLVSLAPGDRLIVELYFLQDLKYAEIAQLVGLNINTVSGKLRRAKAKLRKLMEEESL